MWPSMTFEAMLFFCKKNSVFITLIYSFDEDCNLNKNRNLRKKWFLNIKLPFMTLYNLWGPTIYYERNVSLLYHPYKILIRSNF